MFPWCNQTSWIDKHLSCGSQVSFRGTCAIFLYAQSSFQFRPKKCFHILVWVFLSTHHWPWNRRDWFYSRPRANILSAVSHRLFGWRHMRRTDLVQIHTWIESHKTFRSRVESPPSLRIWRSWNEGSVPCCPSFPLWHMVPILLERYTKAHQQVLREPVWLPCRSRSPLSFEWRR